VSNVYDQINDKIK